ncbi:MAG: hypothetical protein BGO86_12090 [Chryseobacterium sp. 36-9]|nr:MAG: hypothetical protein BGO86_12090 [Chryseobacterium sp. 36-9]
MNILFGIISFREQYVDSLTFQDLIASHKNSGSNQDLNLFIFDNTDNDSWKAEQAILPNCNIVYHHNRNNVGISKAYNFIAKYAKEQNFDYIVFLDQDTNLPLEAYTKYIESTNLSIDIAAPLIFENNTLLSPSKYNNYRTSFYENIKEDKIKLENVSCINSGLLIKTDFFFNVGGYNEKLRLDFCDHEFVQRVKKFTNYLYIISLRLEQNFSTNTNSKEKALFRYSLFIKDIKAFKKINNNDFLITLLVDLPHLLRLTLQYKSLLFIKKRLQLR